MPAVELFRASLNMDGYADYVFTDADARLIQIERELASTVLSNPVQVEDEIRRHSAPAGTTCSMILLIEGLVEPYSDGTVVLRLVGTKAIPQFFSRTRYEAYVAWLWQVQENGVEVIQSPSLEASAIAISSIYWNAQKPEHHTFRRHFKPITSWHPNPFVVSLMGLVGAELGEKKASQLAEKYKSFKELCGASRADIDKLPGWGEATAAKLLRALGVE